jgi:4-hydroxy-3-polyprenylbenzoate decarboxylase
MYRSLEECILDLEKKGELIRIHEQVDPNQEMAAIHRRVFENGGPALLFENVLGTRYRAASNLFGTVERSKYIFRHTWDVAKQIIQLRNEPLKALQRPVQSFQAAIHAITALPWEITSGVPVRADEISISQLPRIHHWPGDGGAFVTLPQVYSEDPDKPGMMKANVGMYRVQLDGNEYDLNREVGIHYQIHRGIGVHHAKANKRGEPLKVSIFIGGPPAHTLAAVMPLPEGLGEMTFAGMLSGRRVRYSYVDGYCISNEADFVITGEIIADETKPEGPFGDHLGYYSLAHPFPVMRVHKVFARRNAIWPFTVVGRPPQEDTAFGALIHELTGDAIRYEIPGVKEVHAVDAAGVHPLLFAIGSERYTPYQAKKQPAELLTIANRILGTGQLSLAKYLFITASDPSALSTHHEAEFLKYIFERIDLRRDLHFQTNTTIDTLDYSGTGLNRGSKVIFAAYGEPLRELCREVPEPMQNLREWVQPQVVFAGAVAITGPKFRNYEAAQVEIAELCDALASRDAMETCPLIILCDDSEFVAATLQNFLWVTFTRSNPSHDLYGTNSRYDFKHWGCDQVIIDARMKPHHAPPLLTDPVVEKNIERLFSKGASLHGIIKD